MVIQSREVKVPSLDKRMTKSPAGVHLFFVSITGVKI